jgi:hypothetical protein
MNFEFKEGLIWIKVALNYTGMWFEIDNCILDTGSASTAIDIDQIHLDYQKPTRIKRLFGIGGTQEVIAQNIAGIKVDNKIIEHFDIEFGQFESKHKSMELSEMIY